jgi:hypothetical protein
VLRADIVLTLHLDPNRDKAIKVILPEAIPSESRLVTTEISLPASVNEFILSQRSSKGW